MLTLAHDIGIDENLGMSTLKSLTLRDADGQTLDIPMVLESIGPDYAQGSMNTTVRLLPMGWQDAGLDRITEVEAQLDYAAPAKPEHVEIPLADTPTELHDGAAQARAVPTDDGWRLTLSGTEQTFYIFDSSAVFARDLSARISQKAHDGLTPSDRTLLARVDAPDAWVQQILVEGRGDAFGLKLYKNMPGPSTHDVTFTSRQQRYSNRELPPPETRELYIDEIPDDASLSLDDVAPEGADENQLNMRLPIGVGSACELSADAPAESGHALVWRPDDERASGFGIFRVPTVTACMFLILSEISTLFPKLRWGFIEASAQWIPWIHREAARRFETAGEELPDSLFEANNIYVTCQIDEDLPWILK